MGAGTMKTRQKPRPAIAANGQCRVASGMQWDVALADLSEGGCRIADPRGVLRKGAMVELFIAGNGPHRAHVRWVEKGEAGVAFVRMLDGALLDCLHNGTAPPTKSAAQGFGPKRMVC